jgi:hypothetical protein
MLAADAVTGSAIRYIGGRISQFEDVDRTVVDTFPTADAAPRIDAEQV